MYIDLLDSENYLLVNVSLIKLLGLSGAAYCSELFTIMKKAIKKDKLVRSVYVKVDRDYVATRTGVSEVEQKALEDAWQKMDLIERNPGDADNVFNINAKGFLVLISGQKEFTNTEIDKLKKKLKPKTSEKEREGKQIGKAKAIKESFVCTSPKVKEKLWEWVDTIVFETTKPLSKRLADIFWQSIKEYADGDEGVMLKVIQKSITNGYVESTYAISVYEEELKHRKPRSSKRATADDIVEGEKF